MAYPHSSTLSRYSSFRFGKLTASQVTEGRLLASYGVSGAELALRYDVSRSAVWKMVTGATYREVPAPTIPTRNQNKLNPSLVAEARLLAFYGITDGELARHYGASHLAVWFAVTGKTYKYVSAPPVRGRGRTNHQKRTLEDWQASQIYYDFWHGHKVGNKLAKKHRTNPGIVYKIAYGESYRDVTSRVNLDA